MWYLISIIAVGWVGTGGSFLSKLNRGELDEPDDGKDPETDILLKMFNEEGLIPFILLLGIVLVGWPIVLAMIASNKRESERRKHG